MSLRCTACIDGLVLIPGVDKEERKASGMDNKVMDFECDVSSVSEVGLSSGVFNQAC